MSRNEVCDAWQIGFNQLIYCASFLEEDTLNLEASDIEHFKREFEAVRCVFITLAVSADRLSGMICFVSRPQYHRIRGMQMLMTRRVRSDSGQTNPVRNSPRITSITSPPPPCRVGKPPKRYKSPNPTQPPIRNVLVYS